MIVPYTLLLGMCEISSYTTSFSLFGVVSLSNFIYCNWYEMVSHYGFNIFSWWLMILSIFSWVKWTFIIYCDWTVKIFPRLKNWVIFWLSICRVLYIFLQVFCQISILHLYLYLFQKFLPVFRLPFHLLNDAVWWAESFYIDKYKCISFLGGGSKEGN